MMCSAVDTDPGFCSLSPDLWSRPDLKRGKDMYRHELKATVPQEILECSAVSREINFTSKQEIRRFRLEQRVFLKGACIEGGATGSFYPLHGPEWAERLTRPDVPKKTPGECALNSALGQNLHQRFKAVDALRNITTVHES